MEIIVKLDSYSFYHNKKQIYASGTIIEKYIFDLSDPDVDKYRAVSSGENIALKYTGERPLEILPLLTELILRIKIQGTEKPQKNNGRASNEIKYKIASVEKCVILKAQS